MSACFFVTVFDSVPYYVWGENMDFFDAHCDFLWVKATGRESAYEDFSGNGRVTLAVFEGDGCRDLIGRQTEIYKTQKTIKSSRIAFEGLSWATGSDEKFILSLSPLYAAPVWNRKNAFGGSCFDDGPVTGFGKAFLDSLDKNCVYIDLAHSGKEMFASCTDCFENIMFSHGCIFDIVPHPRNITKAQLNTLINRNAFFGLTFYSGFAGKNTEDFFRHIEYVLDAGGENILGIGSDIDGCRDIVLPTNGAKTFEYLKNEMKKRNYPEKIIDNILYKNLRNREIKFFAENAQENEKNR